MDSPLKNSSVLGWFDSHGAIRTDGYVILASLLRSSPSEEVMKILQTLAWSEALPEDLRSALEALRHAGRTYRLDAVESEFNSLFVGPGSGETVPCASWYREKKIQARPLASLRTDLMALGIVRRTEGSEYEDHAAALCEIMALISHNPGNEPFHVQAKFFQRHIAPWMIRFFEDLQSARNADFYRVVGLFGARFLEYEEQFLKEHNRSHSIDRLHRGDDEGTGTEEFDTTSMKTFE